MVTRRGQGEGLEYTILLPPAYVEQLGFVAAEAGLSSGQVRYRELPPLHERDTETAPDEPDMHYYLARYDSFATWQKLHDAMMDRLMDRALQAVPSHGTHNAA